MHSPFSSLPTAASPATPDTAINVCTGLASLSALRRAQCRLSCCLGVIRAVLNALMASVTTSLPTSGFRDHPADAAPSSSLAGKAPSPEARTRISCDSEAREWFVHDRPPNASHSGASARATEQQATSNIASLNRSTMAKADLFVTFDLSFPIVIQVSHNSFARCKRSLLRTGFFGEYSNLKYYRILHAKHTVG